MLLALLFLAAVAGCDRSPALPLPAASKGLDLSAESYEAVRSRFRSNLVWHGPSPAAPERLSTPAGSLALRYHSKGLDLRAFVTPDPADGRAHPAVLFLHGGFSFGAGHWDMTKPFRDAGFVVMVPVLRGENGQPGDFSLFLNEVDDVLAAAGAFEALPYVDKTRLFIAGHSVGGTLAMLAAMACDRFRGAASISGSPDQVVYVRGRPEIVPFDPSIPGEFRIRSPVAFADRFRCPARLYFGDEEIWLQASTERTAGLAAGAHLDVKAVVIPGDHATAVPDAIERAIAFFRGL